MAMVLALLYAALHFFGITIQTEIDLRHP